MKASKAVEYYLTDAGYNEEEIQWALGYAMDACDDPDNGDEVGRLAMYRLLYDDEYLEEACQQALMKDGAIDRHIEVMGYSD